MSRQAVVTVERIRYDSGWERASALAAVFRMPASVNHSRVLSLSGILPELPPPESCEVLDHGLRSSPALGSVDGVELVDVGDVTLLAGNHTVKLGRKAFPSVIGRFSGVVYSTPDRDHEPLPAAQTYVVTTRGRAGETPSSPAITAPAALEGLALNGVTLDEVTRLSLAQPIEVTWSAGHEGALVWVEFGRNTSPVSLRCAFADTAGRGTVPEDLVTLVGAGRLQIHRQYVAPANLEGVSGLRFVFDFSISHRLDFD